MEQTRTRRAEFSETDVANTFKEMGLETREQRDEVLRRGTIDNPVKSDRIRYIIRLSNTTEAAPTA